MKRACAAHEGVVEQMVARKGHSLEVTGSSPVYATKVFSWFVLSAPGPHQPLRLTGSKHAEFFKVNKDVHPASLSGAVVLFITKFILKPFTNTISPTMFTSLINSYNKFCTCI